MADQTRSVGQAPALSHNVAELCEKGRHARRCFESAQLFEGLRELLIDHNGELYRLHVTRNDKLILSK